MLRRIRLALVFSLVFFLASASALGEIWIASADGQVVERADVIVVGRIKPDSITYVHHTATNPAHGHSWEHHLTLIVSRSIKGELPKGEHRIIVHFGLTPCVGGHAKQANWERNLPDRSKDVIEIVGSAMRQFPPGPEDDLRQDHVWLLRRGRAGGPVAKATRDAGRESGDKPATAPEKAIMLGVREIQDIQRVERLEYLQLYLRKDPETALRRHIQEHPKDAVRVLPYLRHLAVQRAIADPDPAKRVERLIPYFSSYVLYCGHDEAGDGIEAAGEVAIPYLAAMLHDSGLYESRRTQVILMLGRIGSTRAVPVLVDLVKRQSDALEWVTQAGTSVEEKLKHPNTVRQLHELQSAIYSLGRVGDKKQSPLVRGVIDRWSKILDKDSEFLEYCRGALKRLEQRVPR